MMPKHVQEFLIMILVGIVIFAIFWSRNVPSLVFLAWGGGLALLAIVLRQIWIKFKK